MNQSEKFMYVQPDSRVVIVYVEGKILGNTIDKSNPKHGDNGQPDNLAKPYRPWEDESEGVVSWEE